MNEPPSLLSLIDTALDRYIARAPLYLGVAALIAIAGSSAMYFAKLDSAESLILTLLLVAPLHGIVAIGTAADGEPPALRDMLLRVARKWPELIFAQVFVAIIGTLTVLCLLDNSVESAIGLIPFSIAWGAASLCDVIVALDEPEPAGSFLLGFLHRVQFFGRAIAQSFAYAFKLRNVSRLATLALLQIPAFMLVSLIEHHVQLRHLHIDGAWIAFIVSCFADGVYEAIFTQVLQRFRAA